MRSYSLLTRAFCVFVAFSFLPTGVQFWNFLPATEAHAAEPPKGPSDVAAWDEMLTRIKVAALVNDGADEFVQRERLAKHLGRMSDPFHAPQDGQSSRQPVADVAGTGQSTLGTEATARSEAPYSGQRTAKAGIPYASGSAERFQLASVRVLRGRQKAADVAVEAESPVDAPAVSGSQADTQVAEQSSGGASEAVAPALVPVESARAMLASGDYASGAAALITRVDWDENSETRAEADLSLRLVWREAAAGSLSDEQLDAVEAALPAWESLGTAEGANQVMRFSQLRADRHAAMKRPEEAARYYQKAQHQAAEIMDVFPESPALIETAESYMEVSRRLGIAEVHAALGWAWDCVKRKETPRARAFAVRSAAAPIAHRLFSDRLAALLMSGDAMADGKSAEYAGWMKDNSVLPRIKAELSYSLSLAYYEIGAWGRAVKELDSTLALAPEGDEVYYRVRLAQIYIMNRLDYENSERCLGRLQEYLDKHPESPFLDRTLMYMAEVYQRMQNNLAAYETYGSVVQLFPSSTMREGAERTRKFLEDHVLNTQGGMEIPDGKPVLPAVRFAMSCGPDALNRMLALQGVPATSAALSKDAGTSPEGTALSGMLKSARNRDVSLAGVRAEDPCRLPVPFVAHTTLNHFYMVTNVTEEVVTFRDNVGTQTMSLERFKSIFTGVALVRGGAAEGLDRVDEEVMRLAKGGTFPGGCPAACPNGDCPGCDPPAPPTPSGSGDGPPPPATCGDGDGQGSVGGPGMRLGGGGRDGDAHVPGSNESGKAIFGTGITAPEMRFKIMGRQGSQSLRQTDISVPIRGGGKLELTRSYFNSWGTPNNLNDSLYSGFGRGFGIGWSHNFSDIMIASTNEHQAGVPEGYAVSMGCTTRYYQFACMPLANVFEYTIDGVMGDDDGYSGGAQTHELGNKLRFNTTTGRQTLILPDGSSKTYYGGRLESVTDSNGNTVGLGFDGGQLDTVNGPDDRFLQIYWNNYGRISGVELRKWTGGGQSVAIRGVSYTYTDNTNHSSLARVTYSDNSYNEFTYGKRYTSDDFYAYMSDVRDRSGLHTVLTATYGYDEWQPTWYRVLCQTVTHGATGLYSVYDQTDGTGSLVAVSQYTAPSGGSLVSKSVLYGDASAYHNNQEQYFADASGSTKRIWQYVYSHANYRDLNLIFDPAGLFTYRYEYNAQGQVTKMYRTPTSPPLQFEYDSTGLMPVKRIDPNLAESTYTRDAAGNVTYYHHPSMGTGSVHYVYDSYGQMTSMTDPSGKTWSYTYDARGNMTSATEPYTSGTTHTTTMTYDDFGRVLSVLDPKSKLTEFEYTDSICGGCGGAQSQLALIRDHDNNETTFEYDSAGMLVRAENAAGQAVVNTYDSMHRLTHVAHENGPAVAVYSYDALNRVVAAADGDGNVTSYTYNFLGDLTEVTDKAGTTQLVYYNNGNLRQLVDGKNNTTNFYYYNAGGLAKMVNALGQTVKYTYDVMGNLTQVGAGTNGDVDTVTYAYPASGASCTGLLQSVTYLNAGVSKSVGYTYDANSQVTAVTDWLGTSGATHTFEYYDNGQLKKYTDFDGAYQEYTYDAAGNLETLRDYEGTTSTYGYDNLHRLISLASPGGKNWGFTYDPVGRLLTQTMPNGISSQYSYDALGRPSSLQHKDGTAVVDGWNYTYDTNNNLRNIASARTGDSGAWTYLYDGRNRLREAFHKNSAGALVSRHGFQYDAGDNLTSKTVTPYTQQFSDSFADGNITASPAWLSTGMWSAASQEAVNTANPSITPEISQNIANGNAEYWFSYKIEDASVANARVRLLLRRTNATSDCVRVLFTANSFNIKQQSAGVTTDLLTDASVVTASNTWYDVYVRANGGTIEVWRGLRGQKLALLGSTSSATVMSGEAVAFDAYYNTVAHFDDMRMSVPRTANQSFTSTFTGTFDGWVQEAGTFSAAGNYLTNTTLVSGKMRRDTANGDFQMKFSYRDTSAPAGPEAQIRFRQADASNFALLRMWPTSFHVSEVRAGTTVALGSASWSTTSGTWYDVTIVADGTHIEVWRGPKGGAQARVCSVDTATILSGTKSTLVVGANGTYAFDDFQMTAEDLSTTTYAYDTANQLTAMTADGTTTNFTYDDWGRMSGKAQGAYAATYGYRFGDKLKSVNSNFPGENAVVQYNYDGLGKRRLEQLDGTTVIWFRWSGWEESGEYGGVPNTWTVGAKQTGYVPGLAAFDGADPVTANWRFNLNDHLGSPRQMLGQDKSAKARFDFSPYGELMRSAGLPLTVGYTGHRWDPAIGQYFAPFRYYSPQTARWNMRDPLGYIDGLNKYAYAKEDPAGRNDELGFKGTEKECADIWTKIVRTQQKIAKKEAELEYYQTHPAEQKLPEFSACQDSKPGTSIEGHRKKLEEYKKSLKKNIDNFNENCRDKNGKFLYPVPFIAPAPVRVPGPPNSSLQQGCPADWGEIVWVF